LEIGKDDEAMRLGSLGKMGSVSGFSVGFPFASGLGGRRPEGIYSTAMVVRRSLIRNTW